MDVFLLEDKTRAHGEREAPLLSWNPRSRVFERLREGLGY